MYKFNLKREVLQLKKTLLAVCAATSLVCLSSTASAFDFSVRHGDVKPNFATQFNMDQAAKATPSFSGGGGPTLHGGGSYCPGVGVVGTAGVRMPVGDTGFHTGAAMTFAGSQVLHGGGSIGYTKHF